MSTSIEASATDASSACATPASSRHLADGDRGLVAVEGDAGNDGGFHVGVLLANQRARAGLEARQHAQLHAVARGELDRAQVQHARPLPRELEHLLEAHGRQAGAPRAPCAGRSCTRRPRRSGSGIRRRRARRRARRRSCPSRRGRWSSGRRSRRGPGIRRRRARCRPRGPASGPRRRRARCARGLRARSCRSAAAARSRSARGSRTCRATSRAARSRPSRRSRAARPSRADPVPGRLRARARSGGPSNRPSPRPRPRPGGPAPASARTCAATAWMRATEPTEVPPYFWTISMRARLFQVSAGIGRAVADFRRSMEKSAETSARLGRRSISSL